ncbi:hypothetical protein [Sphingomonas sp. BK069]|uniref:hypothetical protein n=1 Tax=Sphingomonas sp. BK069 TaxID=2586979 RepID=UPI0016185F18|nr:hypothetical protein [Sphingomonas sp. BK069]MBB3348347.1 hypothetical protein [Sphingomonas sp. BK069]
MSRQIVSKEDIAKATTMGPGAKPVKAPDTYVERLVKYIPPDVIAAYVTIEGMIAAAENSRDKAPLSWAVFVIILIACPLYLRRSGVIKPLQLILSTLAFAVWAFAYNGPPFSLLQLSPIYGAVLLTLTTFLIPIIVPESSQGPAKPAATAI